MKLFLFTLLASTTLYYSLLNHKNLKDEPKVIYFALSAEYPPYEYNDHGEIKGFHIDLARLVAEKLGKIPFFNTIEFNSILPALSSGQVDVAISTFNNSTQSTNEYGFALKKHSVLTQKINQVLHEIEKNGELENLKMKWLENTKWQS